MHSLTQLRKVAKQTRRKLSKYQQLQAESHVLKQVVRHPHFKNAHHIGIYLSAFGEIQTRQLILFCFRLKKQVYLPQINPMNQTLNWVNISLYQYKNQRFHMHYLGMREPKNHRGHPIHCLDLLFLPLVLADQVGTRIGMGGGYYDRSLAQSLKQPYRIGLAHDFQVSQSHLPRKKWDQPLDALITPTQSLLFKRSL